MQNNLISKVIYLEAHNSSPYANSNGSLPMVLVFTRKVRRNFVYPANV